jgi:integrase
LRKPGGKGWYPHLLSDVPDTEDNFKEACRLAQKYVMPSPVDGPTTVSDLIDNWLSYHLIQPINCTHQWANSIRALIGGTRISSIKPSFLKQFRLHMAEATYQRHLQKQRFRYSQTTIRKYGELLEDILRWAGEQGQLIVPKWVDPGWPEKKVGKKHISLDEIERTLAALLHPKRSMKMCEKCKQLYPALGFHLHARSCDGKPRSRREDYVGDEPHPAYWIVRFALDCGGRPDEICLLQWEYVDFASQVITIPETDHKTGLKTGETRKLYPNDDGMDVLYHIRKQGKLSPYVFLNRLGRPYKPQGVRSALRFHCGKSGMYALRHSYAVYALMQGMEVATLQKLMGHKSVTTTMGYAKVQELQAIQAARSLVGPHELADAVRQRLRRAFSSTA